MIRPAHETEPRHEEPRQQQQKQQDSEQQEVEERSAPGGHIVYKAICKEGEDELERPSSALAFSGLAAGLSMGFSLIAEGILHANLPDKPWRILITKLGYSVGFLIVILGRQQLFTENTLTPILPLLQKRDGKTLLNVLRLWGVVFAANMLGGLIIAWACAKTSAFEPHVRDAFSHIGHTAMHGSFGTILIKGIFAGWLIALMVWLLPFAETARVGVIIIVTYIVGIGQFSHIIAGSIETFVIGFLHEKPWTEIVGSYVVPTLIGNIIGGVTLVDALNHAQVVAGSDGTDV
jgi:formate/nitrite transporter FocA (FNT family)